MKQSIFKPFSAKIRFKKEAHEIFFPSYFLSFSSLKYAVSTGKTIVQKKRNFFDFLNAKWLIIFMIAQMSMNQFATYCKCLTKQKFLAHHVNINLDKNRNIIIKIWRKKMNIKTIGKEGSFTSDGTAVKQTGLRLVPHYESIR